MRRVGEAVTVRVAGADPAARPGSGYPEGTPTSFLWRGRLYVVREVLAHWRERQAWWTAAAARAVHGEGDDGGLDEPGGFGDVGNERAQQGEGARRQVALAQVRLLAPGTRVVLDQEHEVWRVEASAGRSFGTGVYDLSREGSESRSTWQLLRVTD